MLSLRLATLGRSAITHVRPPTTASSRSSSSLPPFLRLPPVSRPLLRGRHISTVPTRRVVGKTPARKIAGSQMAGKSVNNMSAVVGMPRRHPPQLQHLSTSHAVAWSSSSSSSADPSVAISSEEHVKTGDVLRSEAEEYVEKEMFREALPLLERSMTAFEAANVPDTHAGFARSTVNIAFVQQSLGKLDDAEINYRLAVTRMEQSFGSSFHGLGETLLNFAELLSFRDKISEAEEACERSIYILKEYYGPRHELVAAATGNLSSYLCAQAKFQEAMPHLRNALDMFEFLHGRDSQYALGALAMYMRALKDSGQEEELKVLMAKWGDHADRAAVVLDESDPQKDVDKMRQLFTDEDSFTPESKDTLERNAPPPFEYDESKLDTDPAMRKQYMEYMKNVVHNVEKSGDLESKAAASVTPMFSSDSESDTEMLANLTGGGGGGGVGVGVGGGGGDGGGGGVAGGVGIDDAGPMEGALRSTLGKVSREQIESILNDPAMHPDLRAQMTGGTEKVRFNDESWAFFQKQLKSYSKGRSPNPSAGGIGGGGDGGGITLGDDFDGDLSSMEGMESGGQSPDAAQELRDALGDHSMDDMLNMTPEQVAESFSLKRQGKSGGGGGGEGGGEGGGGVGGAMGDENDLESMLGNVDEMMKKLGGVDGIEKTLESLKGVNMPNFDPEGKGGAFTPDMAKKMLRDFEGMGGADGYRDMKGKIKEMETSLGSMMGDAADIMDTMNENGDESTPDSDDDIASDDNDAPGTDDIMKMISQMGDGTSPGPGGSAPNASDISQMMKMMGGGGGGGGEGGEGGSLFGGDKELDSGFEQFVKDMNWDDPLGDKPSSPSSPSSPAASAASDGESVPDFSVFDVSDGGGRGRGGGGGGDRELTPEAYRRMMMEDGGAGGQGFMPGSDVMFEKVVHDEYGDDGDDDDGGRGGGRRGVVADASVVKKKR